VEYISFEQLSLFIEQHCLPYIDLEHRITKSFVTYYTVTTALKFSFHLDIRNRNMISLKRAAHSDMMVELQSLVEISRYLSSKTKGGGYPAGKVFGFDVDEDKRFLKDQVFDNSNLFN
jgi:hypothetical protein